MNDDMQDAIARIVLVAGRLDALIPGLQQQAQDAQVAMQKTREQEEAKFKQAMVAQFQDQQHRLEAALRPRIAWAWKIIAVLASLSILLLAGYWLLLKQADARLRTAQARADTVELKAEVLEASKHVDITSCGGRPCIRIDRSTPVWKSKTGDYILVDTPSGKETRKRP